MTDSDLTIAKLIECYLTDRDSTFQKLRYRSKRNYGYFLDRIEIDHGAELVANIKGRQVKRWHEDWSARGIPMAHGLIGSLRTILTFGATMLDDDACRAAKVLLHDMKFAMAKPRTVAMTAEQAVAVRTAAHAAGFHSIALAQAFQFEVMLRQRDVIGEWVPMTEPGMSDITGGDNHKWLRGIRWSEVDDNMILKHITSKRQKEIEFDLKLAPMVMEELKGQVVPSAGPIIVSELSGLPWDDNTFRFKWRWLATQCGIPKTVRNMDSRAGGITEASDAGASLEMIRHAATHSDVATTARYSRNPAEKTAEVAIKRVEYRNKTSAA